MVQADEISDMHLVERLRNDERIIWVAHERKQVSVFDLSKDVVLAMGVLCLYLVAHVTAGYVSRGQKFRRQTVSTAKLT